MSKVALCELGHDSWMHFCNLKPFPFRLPHLTLLLDYSDMVRIVCFSVVPLLLLFCLCGGAAALENMKPIPYDTKQQLISYHTEGQGEDKVHASLSFGVPVLVELEKHIACLCIKNKT